MIMVIVAGAFITAILTMSKPLVSSGWPFLRIMGCAAFIIALLVAVSLLAYQGRRGLSCERRDAKWVIARGFCGTAQFVFSVCAALAGAGVGDIEALGSMNAVVAAVAGRVFLGERLGLWSYLAVLLSVIGAVVISEPWADSNHSGSFSPSFLGYVLALLAGTFYGLMFISSRAGGAASTWLMTFSAMGQRSAVCWILTLSGVVPDGDVGTALAHPWQAVSLVVVVAAVTFSGNFLMTAGSKRCPAAVSATLTTATSMGVGYAAQVILFHSPPNYMKLIGAGLMLLAVVIMALSRLPRKAQGSSLKEASDVTPGAVAPGADLSLSPSLSLASFVASEFAQRQMPPIPEEEIFPRSAASSTLRSRQAILSSASPSPWTLGVPSAAA
mmetsp:Transcript_143162/g.398977  ORF Transcript_143162/g.398977 Transcript_143162/m.398977 type:complete len:385 (-) Transcript_143162:396-1550(-)